MLVLALLAAAEPCRARYITLDVRPSAEFIERFLRVSASITNAGDESAYKVQVSLEAQGHFIVLPTIDQIGAAEQKTIAATLPVGEVAPGSYTAILRTRYTDFNGYQFSTVTVVPVSKWVSPPSPVSALMTAGEITSSGEIRIRVTNLSRRISPVRVRVVAPDELMVSPPEIRLRLQNEQEEEQVRFTVRNASALPGSVYAVFAVLDTDVQDLHASTTVSARIPILAPGGMPSSPFIIAGLAATPIILLALMRLFRSASAHMKKIPHRRMTTRKVSG